MVMVIVNSSAIMYPQDSSQLSVLFFPRNQYFLQENDLGFSLIDCKPVQFMSYVFWAFIIKKPVKKKRRKEAQRSEP